MVWTYILIILVIIALGVLIFFLLGRGERKRLASKYSPPGEMVDVGGFRLHIKCQGEGGPPVVFEAGQGGGVLAWGLVPEQVASFNIACVYDRAGLGWSEPSPNPRSAKYMVEELRALLKNAGVQGPYILVGHSTGAMNARLFAYLYPQEVAGMVLVDPAHEEQFSPEPLQKAMQQMRSLMPMMFLVRRLKFWSGIPARKLRLDPAKAIRDDPSLRESPNFPHDLAEAYLALNATRSSIIDADSAELRELPNTWKELRQARSKGLGDIPLVVVSHGKPAPMMTPELTELMEKTFQDLHEQQAGTSSRGRRIVAEGSGHNVPLDRPDVVVEAVREVAQTVQMAVES